MKDLNKRNILIKMNIKTSNSIKFEKITFDCYSSVYSLSVENYYDSFLNVIDNGQSIKLLNDRSGNAIYGIEVSYVPNINNEIFDYAIEYDKETPTYANESGIEISESEKQNGKKYIIAVIEDATKSLLITFTKNHKNSYQMHYRISFVIVAEKSELIDITFEREFEAIRYKSNVNGKFTEIFNLVGIQYATYHILVYHTKDVTIDSVDSTFYKDNIIASRGH